MAFDPHLTPLLQSCSNADLDPVIQYLVKPITSELNSDLKYLHHSPNHTVYIAEVVEELRLFGGNTFMNVIRGE